MTPERTPTQKRTAVAGLVLAASTLVGIAFKESYTADAVIPVPGDVPTLGFGMTRHADGSPVRMGEKTAPPRALVDLLRDASKFERAVKRCAPVPMYPYEFSAYVSFSYNVGEYAFCHSTLAAKLAVLDYAGACAELLRWDRAGGRVVRGLTVRRKAEFKECTGETK
jgi:lysozyme